MILRGTLRVDFLWASNRRQPEEPEGPQGLRTLANGDGKPDLLHGMPSSMQAPGLCSVAVYCLKPPGCIPFMPSN